MVKVKHEYSPMSKYIFSQVDRYCTKTNYSYNRCPAALDCLHIYYICLLQGHKFYVILWPFPVEITRVLTTFNGAYPCVQYFYVQRLIMTSHRVTMLLEITHCDITMGNDVARIIHCDITMGNDVTMCTSQYLMTLL